MTARRRGRARSRIPALIALSWSLALGLVAHAGDTGPPFGASLDRGLEAARHAGKPTVVVYVAAWCPLCRELRREVLPDPEVMGLADRLEWILIDIDRQLSTARDGGVQAVPTIRLFDAGGGLWQEMVGLPRTAEVRGQLQRLLRGEEAAPAPAGGPGEPIRAGPSSDLTWQPLGYRSGAICFSHVGYGPLTINSQSPFQSLRLNMQPGTPSTLGRGKMEASARVTWVNSWANSQDERQTDEYLLDFESVESTVALSYGLSDVLMLEAGYQERRRFGGDMDGFIQGFHDLFGIDQAGRDLYPEDGFRFELRPRNGQPDVILSDADRGVYARGVLLTLQHNLTCGRGRVPALSYSVTGRFEVGGTDELEGGTGADLAISLAASRRLGSWYLYGTLGHAWLGRESFRGLSLQGTQLSALAAGEWRIRPRQAVLLQLLVTEGVLVNLGPFSESSYELTLGWKREIARGSILEVGLIENILNFDNSPDFGLHLGFSQRF